MKKQIRKYVKTLKVNEDEYIPKEGNYIIDINKMNDIGFNSGVKIRKKTMILE